MWKRFTKTLRCPACRNSLHQSCFSEATATVSEERTTLAGDIGVLDDEFSRFVESGLLLCNKCRACFPIMHGLPVMLLYTTPLRERFTAQFEEELSRFTQDYHFPNLQSPRGEKFAMTSFSQEWQQYHYDGVLWNNTYDDLEATFLAEIGINRKSSSFLEIGCGLGVATSLAHKHLRSDAVGVDVSLACMRAAQHFRTNPFLHFVQASAFNLPFEKNSFDVVYSRGVLHHTYSTHEAFKAMASCCKIGGRQYLWVYGPGSNNETLFRRVAYMVEMIIRPILRRRPTSRVTTAVLSCLTLPYVIVNWFHRLTNPTIQKYNFERALHAARDRFTPLYAHRHHADEVMNWFTEAGFHEVELVDWREVPPAQQDTYRRNVGVRGRRIGTL